MNRANLNAKNNLGLQNFKPRSAAAMEMLQVGRPMSGATEARLILEPRFEIFWIEVHALSEKNRQNFVQGRKFWPFGPSSNPIPRKS